MSVLDLAQTVPRLLRWISQPFGCPSCWVSHQELRRDRAVLFADHLEPGKHHTTVFLRATTPGEYLMPAGSAAMMYYPEVYGRTTGRRLIVR